jgi:hypothetical protein
LRERLPGIQIRRAVCHRPLFVAHGDPHNSPATPSEAACATTPVHLSAICFSLDMGSPAVRLICHAERLEVIISVDCCLEHLPQFTHPRPLLRRIREHHGVQTGSR